MINKKFLLNKLPVLKLHFKILGFKNFVSYILQRIFIPKNEIIKVSLQGYLHPVYLRNCPSDTQIFTQIFLREELKIDLKKPPKTIIDGGANIGLAALYLINRYPETSIYSIEPDHSNFKILQKNTIHYNAIACYNNGIWNRNAKLKIINMEAGNESFIVSEVDDDNKNNDVIHAITINEIIKLNKIQHIDLLKLDIEGSERKVFKDNYTDWLSITDNLMIEIHNWIDEEAENTVMLAVKDQFKCRMAGEYHFFSKI